MLTEIVVILLLLLLLLGLILTASGKRGRKDRNPKQTGSDRPDPPSMTKCPLCGEWLSRGERVHSHLYPGKPDGLMHIWGCPRCYPDHPGGHTPPGKIRSCPVCHGVLGGEDYLIARVFQKPEKTQVHVLGCPRCRENRS